MENSFSCLILRATCGTRTRDPRITNALLYQLSQGGALFLNDCKDTKKLHCTY